MKNFKTFTVYCNADEAVVIADVLADYQKQIKDLETANARLFERNHELQVDAEESMKEVEEYSKRNQALLQRNMSLVGELSRLRADHRHRLSEVHKLLNDLGQPSNWDYSPYMQGMYNGMERALATLESREPEYKSVEWFYNKSPKSKFVITIEEF